MKRVTEVSVEIHLLYADGTKAYMTSPTYQRNKGKDFFTLKLVCLTCIKALHTILKVLQKVGLVGLYESVGEESDEAELAADEPDEDEPPFYPTFSDN